LNDSQRRELSNDIFYRSTGSFELVLSPAILGFLGFLLDRAIGTVPIFTILFALAGIAGAACRVYYGRDGRARGRDEGAPRDRTATRPGEGDTVTDVFLSRHDGPSPAVQVARDIVKRGIYIAPIAVALGAAFWGTDGAASGAHLPRRDARQGRKLGRARAARDDAHRDPPRLAVLGDEVRIRVAGVPGPQAGPCAPVALTDGKPRPRKQGAIPK
jgi:hypothetical protein